jgi:hypothetical protein
MRYVSSIPPPPKSPNTRQVGGLTAVRSVKAVQLQEPNVDQQAVQREAVRLEEERQRRSEGQFPDRRKICRRVTQQPVLVELRSGVERRRRSQREGDPVDHIDEIA